MRSCIRAGVCAGFVASLLSAQTLSVSSTSATAGGAASLSVSLAAGGQAPAGLQWTIQYPSSSVTSLSASAGPALTAAGKSISCASASGSYTCLAYGLNGNTIADGVVATISVGTAASASGSIALNLSGTIASAADGSAMSLGGTGGTITLGTATPVSVSIAPTTATLGPSQTQTFTATVSGTTNNAVTWTLNPAVGTVSNGTYTAPASISALQTVTITATSSADSTKSASASITLQPPPPPTSTVPPVSYLSLYPTSITAGGVSTWSEVFVSSAAPSGGVSVNLASSNPAVLSVPSTVLIPAGATYTTFTYTTYPVSATTNVTITASGGGGTKSGVVTVNPGAVSVGVPVTYLSLYPTTVTAGGISTWNQVLIGSAAPTGGVTITLTSSNPAALSVPASVVIPAGATYTTFPYTTYSVSTSTNVTVTASSGGVSKQGVVTVTPSAVFIPPVIYLSLYPTTMTGGAISTWSQVIISSPAPAGGATVTLTSSNPAAASVPASVVIPAGSSYTTFPITTYKVSAPTTVTITASGGGGTKSGTITVN